MVPFLVLFLQLDSLQRQIDSLNSQNETTDARVALTLKELEAKLTETEAEVAKYEVCSYDENEGLSPHFIFFVTSFLPPPPPPFPLPRHCLHLGATWLVPGRV